MFVLFDHMFGHMFPSQEAAPELSIALLPVVGFCREEGEAGSEQTAVPMCPRDGKHGGMWPGQVSEKAAESVTEDQPVEAAQHSAACRLLPLMTGGFGARRRETTSLCASSAEINSGVGRRGAGNHQRSLHCALSRDLELFLKVGLIVGKGFVSVSNQGQRSEASLLVPEHHWQRRVVVAALQLDPAGAVRRHLLLRLANCDCAGSICGGFRGEVRACRVQPGLAHVGSYSTSSPEGAQRAAPAKTSS